MLRALRPCAPCRPRPSAGNPFVHFLGLLLYRPRSSSSNVHPLQASLLTHTGPPEPLQMADLSYFLRSLRPPAPNSLSLSAFPQIEICFTSLSTFCFKVSMTHLPVFHVHLSLSDYDSTPHSFGIFPPLTNH